MESDNIENTSANIDKNNLFDSSEESQDFTHTDRLLKGLELNINLVENSSKVIETIEEQSPILERELMTTATHIKNLTSRLSMHESVTKVAENVMNSIRAEYNISIFEKNNLDEDETLISSSQYDNYLEDEEEQENDKFEFVKIQPNALIQSPQNEAWLDEFKVESNKFAKSFDDEENYVYEKDIKECRTPNSSLDVDKLEENDNECYEQSELKRVSLNSIRQKLEHGNSIEEGNEKNKSIEQSQSMDEHKTETDEVETFESSSYELNKNTILLNDENFACDANNTEIQKSTSACETFVEEVKIASNLLHVSEMFMKSSESTEPLIDNKEDHDYEIISNEKAIQLENEVHNVDENKNYNDYLNVGRISISESSEPLISEEFDQIECDSSSEVRQISNYDQNSSLVKSRNSSEDGSDKNEDEDTLFVRVEKPDDSFEPFIDPTENVEASSYENSNEEVVTGSILQLQNVKDEEKIEFEVDILTEEIRDLIMNSDESTGEIIQLTHSDSLMNIHEASGRKLSTNNENKSKSLTNIDTLIVSKNDSLQALDVDDESNENQICSSFEAHMDSDENHQMFLQETSNDEINLTKINIQLDHSASNQVDIKNINSIPSDDSFLVEKPCEIMASESAELLMPNSTPSIRYYISKDDANSSSEDDENTENFEKSINSSSSSTSSSVRHGTPRVAAKYISITNNIESNKTYQSVNTNESICSIRIQSEKKPMSIKQMIIDSDVVSNEQIDSSCENFWNKKITSDDSQELSLLNRDDPEKNMSSSPFENEEEKANDCIENKQKLVDSEEELFLENEETNSWIEVDEQSSTQHEMIRSGECDNLREITSGNENDTSDDFVMIEKNQESQCFDSAKDTDENVLPELDHGNTINSQNEEHFCISDNDFFSSHKADTFDYSSNKGLDDNRNQFKRVQSEPVTLSEYEPYKIMDGIADDERIDKSMICEMEILPEIELKLPQTLLDKLNRNIELSSVVQVKLNEESSLENHERESELINRLVKDEVDAELENEFDKKTIVKTDEFQNFEGEDDTSPSKLYKEAGELVEELITNAFNIIELSTITKSDSNKSLSQGKSSEDDDDDNNSENDKSGDNSPNNQDENFNDKRQDSNKDNDVNERKGKNNDKSFEAEQSEQEEEEEVKTFEENQNENEINNDKETEDYEVKDSTGILVTELLRDKEKIEALQNDIKREIINIEINHQDILDRFYKTEHENRRSSECLLTVNEENEYQNNVHIKTTSEPNESLFDEFKVSKINLIQTKSFNDEESYVYEKEIIKYEADRIEDYTHEQQVSKSKIEDIDEQFSHENLDVLNKDDVQTKDNNENRNNAENDSLNKLSFQAFENNLSNQSIDFNRTSLNEKKKTSEEYELQLATNEIISWNQLCGDSTPNSIPIVSEINNCEENMEVCDNQDLKSLTNETLSREEEINDHGAEKKLENKMIISNQSICTELTKESLEETALEKDDDKLCDHQSRHQEFNIEISDPSSDILLTEEEINHHSIFKSEIVSWNQLVDNTFESSVLIKDEEEAVNNADQKDSINSKLNNDKEAADLDFKIKEKDSEDEYDLILNNQIGSSDQIDNLSSIKTSSPEESELDKRELELEYTNIDKSELHHVQDDSNGQHSHSIDSCNKLENENELLLNNDETFPEIYSHLDVKASTLEEEDKEDQSELIKELIDEEQQLIKLLDQINESNDQVSYDQAKTPTNEENSNFAKYLSNEETLIASYNFSQKKISEAELVPTELDNVENRIESTIQASYDAEDKINKRYDEIIDYVKQEQMNMDQLFDYQLDLLRSQIQFNTLTSDLDPVDVLKKSMSSSHSFETANEEIKNSNSSSSSYYTANENYSSPSNYLSACMSSSDEMNPLNISSNKCSSSDSFYSAHDCLASQDSFEIKSKLLNEEKNPLSNNNFESEEFALSGTSNSNNKLSSLNINSDAVCIDTEISSHKDDEDMDNEIICAGSSIVADTDEKENHSQHAEPIDDTVPQLVSKIIEFVQNSDLNLNEQEKAIESQSLIDEKDECEEQEEYDEFDDNNYKKNVYEGETFLASVPEVPEFDSSNSKLDLNIDTPEHECLLSHDKFDSSPEKTPDNKRSSASSSVLEFERLEAQCLTDSEKDINFKQNDFNTATEEPILESVAEEETKLEYQEKPFESKTNQVVIEEITRVDNKNDASTYSSTTESIKSPADTPVALTSENLKIYNESTPKVSTLVQGQEILALNRDRKNSSSRSSNSSLSSSSKSDSLEYELNEKITVDSRSFFSKKSKISGKVSIISSVAVENIVSHEIMPNYDNSHKSMLTTSLCLDSGQSSMVSSYIETTLPNLADKQQHRQNQQLQEGQIMSPMFSSSLCSSLTNSSTSENNFSQQIEIDVTNKDYESSENIEESTKLSCKKSESDETMSIKSVSPTDTNSSINKKRFSSSSSSESQSKSSFSSTHTVIHVPSLMCTQKSIFSGEDLPSFTKTSLSKSSCDIINTASNNNNNNPASSVLVSPLEDLSLSMVSLNQIPFGASSSNHTHHSIDCYCGSVNRRTTSSNQLSRGKK